MKKHHVLISVIVIGLAFHLSCSDNPVDAENPGPPLGVVGMKASLGQVTMFFMWTSDAGTTSGKYNIYRKIADGDFEKLNDELIRAMDFGPGTGYPKALGYMDDECVLDSDDEHRYYVTAVSGDYESTPSDTVSFTPAQVGRDNPWGVVCPNEETIDDLNPTFCWTEHPDAESYFLLLTDDDDEWWPWWAYRTTSNSCEFRDATGTTYLADGDPQLLEANDYELVVWAIDENNCGIASHEADFLTYNPNLVRALITDEYMSAGVHQNVWDQLDDLCTQVPIGDYDIHVIAGQDEDIMTITIVEAGYVGLPDPDIYEVGDPVTISYSLPYASMVTINIYSSAK